MEILRDIIKQISKSRFSRAPHTYLTTPTPVGYSVAPQRDSIRPGLFLANWFFYPGLTITGFLFCAAPCLHLSLLKDHESWSAGWQARRDSSNSTLDWYYLLPRFSYINYQITIILELSNFLIFLNSRYLFTLHVQAIKF